MRYFAKIRVVWPVTLWCSLVFAVGLAVAPGPGRAASDLLGQCGTPDQMMAALVTKRGYTVPIQFERRTSDEDTPWRRVFVSGTGPSGPWAQVVSDGPLDKDGKNQKVCVWVAGDSLSVLDWRIEQRKYTTYTEMELDGETLTLSDGDMAIAVTRNLVRLQTEILEKGGQIPAGRKNSFLHRVAGYVFDYRREAVACDALTKIWGAKRDECRTYVEKIHDLAKQGYYPLLQGRARIAGRVKEEFLQTLTYSPTTGRVTLLVSNADGGTAPVLAGRNLKATQWALFEPQE